MGEHTMGVVLIFEKIQFCLGCNFLLGFKRVLTRGKSALNCKYSHVVLRSPNDMSVVDYGLWLASIYLDAHDHTDQRLESSSSTR